MKPFRVMRRLMFSSFVNVLRQVSFRNIMHFQHHQRYHASRLYQRCYRKQTCINDEVSRLKHRVAQLQSSDDNTCSSSSSSSSRVPPPPPPPPSSSSSSDGTSVDRSDVTRRFKSKDYTPRQPAAFSPTRFGIFLTRDLDPSILPTPMTASTTTVLEFDTKAQSRLRDVIKSQLCRENGIHNRDLKLVWPPSFRGDAPTILMRGRCIVVHTQHVRAVIRHDSVALFEHDVRPMRDLNPFLGRHLHAAYEERSGSKPKGLRRKMAAAAMNLVQEEKEKANVMNDDVSSPIRMIPAVSSDAILKSIPIPTLNEVDKPPDVNSESLTNGLTANAESDNVLDELAFEFDVLEGILMYECKLLAKRFEMLEPALESIMHVLPNNATQKNLEMMLLLNSKLTTFEDDTRQLHSALTSVLESDEDMSSMYLTHRHISGRRRAILDHQEAEILLESYYKHVDDLLNRSALLNKNVTNCEKVTAINLDCIRNRIMQANLRLSLVAVLSGMGGIVAGLFGMNVPIPAVADTQYGFLVITGSIMCTGTALCAGGFIYMKRRRIVMPSSASESRTPYWRYIWDRRH